MDMFPRKILSAVHTTEFNLDKSSDYHLSISIGHGIMKVCCVEATTHACLLLGVYGLPLDKHHPSYVKSLEQVYNEDFFLIKKNWKTVTLSISNLKFTLLPHLLLSKKDLPTYIHAACSVDAHDEALSFTHPFVKLSVVFAENSTVLHWFRKRYMDSNFQIIHQVNAVLEGIHTECVLGHKAELFLWLEEHYLYIIVYNRKKLLYCNVFVYETGEDVLNYLSAVLQIMRLERSCCELLVSGFIEKNSLAYRQLKAYIPRTSLKTKINFLASARNIFKKSGTVPMFYFDLISSFLCNPHSKKGLQSK